MKKQLDYLAKCQVGAVTKIKTDIDLKTISARLPETHMLLSDGTFGFPAGTCETYHVNGVNYNPDMDRSLQDQKDIITSDLKKDGFTEEEINELLENLETKEELPMILDARESKRWLELHPNFKEEALQFLESIEDEVRSEGKIKRK